MNAITLSVDPRGDFGKGAARKLRRDGRIPALIYSKGQEPTHIAVDPHELSHLFQKSGNPNTLLNLQVGDGEAHLCLLKSAQKHPVSRALVHVDFYRVDPDREVRVEVPVRPVGKSEGERLGGRLRILRHTMPFWCKPADIPAAIEIDVTDLAVDEFLRSSQIPAPEKTRAAFDTDFNVIVVIGKRAELEEVEEDEEGEGEGEGEETEEDAE